MDRFFQEPFANPEIPFQAWFVLCTLFWQFVPAAGTEVKASCVAFASQIPLRVVVGIWSIKCGCNLSNCICTPPVSLHLRFDCSDLDRRTAFLQDNNVLVGTCIVANPCCVMELGFKRSGLLQGLVAPFGFGQNPVSYTHLTLPTKSTV